MICVCLCLTYFTYYDNFQVIHVAAQDIEGNGTPLQSSCLEKSHEWRSLVGYSPRGLEESDTTERLHFHFSLSCIGEGNGTPPQCYLPGESQGRGSLVGCCLWGPTESDTTEVT